MNIIYLFIWLRLDGPQNSHTRKQLFFYALKSFNMTWSATPLHRGYRDQPHILAIALDKFLVLWNVKLKANGEMAPLLRAGVFNFFLLMAH